MSFRRAGGFQGMSEVRVHISVSADGYAVGPHQSLENPLGEGGENPPRLGGRAEGMA
jgi:hypothetical protein